jgi:NADPH-dependent 2,4-dienoyl-CoA reductase/sulfur reductase-like enzyme/nitrite reductase/ring-hydroxylating ferredoxin subunit
MEYDIGATTDLTDGAMRGVEVNGRKILLTRIAGACHAVCAVCPHAGGSLDEGFLLYGDVVTCPWHKARFRVTSGRLVDPPAVDDLPRHEVHEIGGRLLVSDYDVPQPAVPSEDSPAEDGAGNHRCVVIAGGGAAGAMAAQTLREEGFTGKVVMIDQEDRLPYGRTVLSKYSLAGKRADEKLPLHGAAFYAAHSIERMVRTMARIDPVARRVELTDGGALTHGLALMATGGAPRPLDVPGGALPGVFMLRLAADANTIAAVAADAQQVVIAGASFIAMEAAACLREQGLAVTVVAPEQAPFERQLGAEVGNVNRGVHEQKRGAFRFGNAVTAVEGAGRAQFVRLRGGEPLTSDLVLVGIGVRPNTAMLAEHLLRQYGGVPVDAKLSVADGLYAAGDMAAFPANGGAIRVEHWCVAQQQGRPAARNMLGAAQSYDAVPYFWTTHFSERLDYVGHAEAWDEVVIDGDRDRSNFIAWHLRAGCVRAVTGWGQDRRMAGVLTYLQERADWTLADRRQTTRHPDA